VSTTGGAAIAVVLVGLHAQVSTTVTPGTGHTSQARVSADRQLE
jgi:hypothetical protein